MKKEFKRSNWIAESDSFTSNFNRDSYRRYSL